MINYKDAGVDIQKGEDLVEKIKEKVKRSYGPEVVSGVGGFCSLYDLGQGKLLAAGTDGVGTKLKLAQMTNTHHTLGIDLVAMCANDVLCCGAGPLFFLDYFSCGVLDLGVADKILEGIVEGCQQAEMPLMGGETAEMPGVYAPGEYDLAGFCVGEVQRENLLDGSSIKDGDTILGLASTGFHSNGFSLIRKLVDEKEKDLLLECLTPTRIYVSSILKILKTFPKNSVKAMAHITGGGLRNILRMSSKHGFQIKSFPHPQEDKLPEVISKISKRSGLSAQELLTTFNMGIGFVLIVEPTLANQIKILLQELGEKVFVLGEVGGDEGVLRLTQDDDKIISIM